MRWLLHNLRYLMKASLGPCFKPVSSPGCCEVTAVLLWYLQQAFSRCRSSAVEKTQFQVKISRSQRNKHAANKKKTTEQRQREKTRAGQACVWQEYGCIRKRTERKGNYKITFRKRAINVSLRIHIYYQYIIHMSKNWNPFHGPYITLSMYIPSTLPHLPGTGLPVVASPLPPPTDSRAGGN